MSSTIYNITETLRRYWTVALVATISIGISALAHHAFKRSVSQAQREAIYQRAQSEHNKILNDLNEYQSALRFMNAFAQSSNYIDRKEWERFIRSADLESKYPAVLAFVYVQRVNPEELEAFTAEAISQGINDFQISTHEQTPRLTRDSTHYIIKYAEPQHRNSMIIGLDVAAKPVNKDVYDRATRTASMQISSPFKLKQLESENAPSKFGLVLTYPSYEPGLPTETIEQREQAVRGWVSISLDTNLFADHVLTRNNHEDHITLSITDYENNPIDIISEYQSGPKAHNHDIQDAEHQAVFTFNHEIGGKRITSSISAHTHEPKQDLSPEQLEGIQQKANNALIIGSLASLLVTALTFFITQGRARAINLANKMNKSLIESEQRQREFAYHAQRANRAKSMFLANMSHEIRTPMTAVLGYTELLKDMIPEHKYPDTMGTAVNRIARAGSHLLTVINDVLDLSKIESGKLAINPVKCHIGEVLAECVATMQVQSNERGVDLQVNFKTSIPESVIADPYRVRQIILNLISNAIKFTYYGSITIELEQIDDTLNIAVADTGVGIEPDRLETIFKPFEQVDINKVETALSYENLGTGLGLSISRQLAEMMQGELSATSVVARGSTFTFSLPIILPESETEPRSINELPTDDSTKHSKKKQQTNTQFSGRILIAEDGPDNQLLLKHFLSKANLELEFVWNGQQAVNRITSDPDPQRAFDLIIMDMQMPVLDGYHATTKLRQQGCTLPILALTANALPGDRQRCLQAGCDEYETKPLNRARLLRTIKRLLENKQSTDQRAA